MSVIWMSLEAVPSSGWLKRKKAPLWVFEEIDNPPRVDGFVTTGEGQNWLGYIVLNNLGVSGQRPNIAPGGYELDFREIEPSKTGKYPRWLVSLDDTEIVVTKAAADQWSLFNTFKDCSPFCAMVTKTRVTLVFEIDCDMEKPTASLNRPWR